MFGLMLKKLSIACHKTVKVISEFFKDKHFVAWSNNTRIRIRVLSFVFVLCYAAISARIVYVSIYATPQQRSEYAKKSFHRNEIVDRNGNILAANLPGYSVYANPQKILIPKEAVDKLATVFKDLDRKKLMHEFTSGKTFAWVKRDISMQEYVEVNSLGIAGIYFEDELKRIYTHGSTLSHVLGYISRDFHGLAGIEKYYDNYLSSKESSGPLELSVDIRIQSVLSKELDNVIEKFHALAGCGVVVDVRSGEVIALSSKPDFDPHDPSRANTEQLFNRASLGVYEMGSVFKTISFAIAFDSQTIAINDVYNLGEFNVANLLVKDLHRHNGWNTVPQIFMNSSNIGTVMMTFEVGPEKFIDYVHKFGFTKQTSIELPERAYPLYPRNKKITDLTLATMSYGYAMSISPLHFVQAMIPIVNGGYKHNITLQKVKDKKEMQSPKILDSATSNNMNKLLRLTVAQGTGKKAEVKGYFVAGKTGTAEKLGKHGYVKNQRYSSFVATVPAHDPQYLVFILLDNPQGIKETFGFATAGFTAAPAVHNIISNLVNIYGMSPYDENDIEIYDKLHVDYIVDEET